MGNSYASVPPDWSKKLWDRDIQTLFSSSKITSQLDFNADFLVLLTSPSKPFKKKRKPSGQEDSHGSVNFLSHLFAFVSKDGEFTALSNALPEILYHVVLCDTKITSVCSFYPSNTLIASSINRNSVIVATFNFLNEENTSDSDLFADSKFEFFEIKGIESPQLVEKVDNDSFIVANSKSSIYLLNMKKYTSNRSNNLTSPYEKLIDSSQPSEPKCLVYFDGFIALSTSSGLLIGKIALSKNSSKSNDKQKNNENEDDLQIIPCSLFYSEYANVHNLTFVKVNDTSVLLFFVTENKQSVKYVQIKDSTNIREEKDSKKNIIQLHILVNDPVEIYGLNPSYNTNNKNEIFITDLIHPTSKNDDFSNKTVIFSCGREILSFTPSLSLFSTSNAKSNPLLLNEKIQIQTDIQVKVQSPNLDFDDPDDIKTYSCFNSIVKLVCTSEPRIFAALFLDGTVVICRHPPYLTQGNGKDESSSTSSSLSIETAILFNYHRCKPILSCKADDFSFLTFDENHVAILWESFPDWWKAPFMLKMFANNDEDEEDKNEYENAEEEKIEDVVDDHL